MKIVLIIPTYNESENLLKLIPLLDIEIAKFPQHDIHILVVDGNSPDGTGETVNKLAKNYPYLHLLLEKEKAGIGAAYIQAFKYAMKNMQADVLGEMDADLQHRPEDFSRLLEKFDEGYDYIIGSRYVKGGSIPKQWAFYRKVLSIGGNIFTKIVLGVFSVNDFTTGFRIARVAGFMDKIDLDAINSKSFAYKMDILFKLNLLGARIAEVPITFGLRDRGISKIEKDTMLDSLRVVLLLRYEASKNLIKFIITGFVGLFVDTGLFSLLRFLIQASSIASAVSGFIAMLTTYTINNFWSFKDRKVSGVKKTASNILVYLASSYVPILFRSWLIQFATATFGNTVLSAYGAFFIGIVLGLIWNYTVYSRVIWKKR